MAMPVRKGCNATIAGHHGFRIVERLSRGGMATMEMRRMKKFIDNAVDAVTDQLEKFSGPTDRAGHAIERAYKLDEAETPHDAIASILTASSKRLGKNNVYTAQEIPTMVKLWEDSLSGTPISAKTARAIIQDQKETMAYGSEPTPA